MSPAASRTTAGGERPIEGPAGLLITSAGAWRESWVLVRGTRGWPVTGASIRQKQEQKKPAAPCVLLGACLR